MILGIIPSRYASTRFPGKPLADINGKTMIQRVYEQAIQATSLSKVVVATDDERIANHVLSFGGEVVITSTEHPSGTDRCWEALQKTDGDYSYVINIQGDEPFIYPSQIDTLAAVLQDGNTQLATLVIPTSKYDVLADMSNVKVVMNDHNEALYFSRMMIPYVKGAPQEEWHKHFTYYRHIGMYAYRADVLEQICQLPVGTLEKAESLEQLRWLQAGYTIQCAITNYDCHSIDNPEDVEKVLRLMNIT